MIVTAVSVPSRYAERGGDAEQRGLIGGPPEWAAGEPLAATAAASTYETGNNAHRRRRRSSEKSFTSTYARALSLDRGSEGILRARGAALESLQPHRTSAPDLFTVNTLLTPP